MNDVARLRHAARALAKATDPEILDGLAAALFLWSGPEGYAARAAREISARDGASEAMLRYGLERTLAAHSRGELKRWLADARREADGARLGPEVILQVLAGNVAGLAIPATLEALLARSAVLLKPASDDPVTPVLLKESLDRAAPRLGEVVAVAGGAGRGNTHTGTATGEIGPVPTHGLDEELLESADLVVASGGEEMAAELPGRVRSPLLLYGPKISVGLVGADWTNATDAWWEECAREIVLWDQRGCLSPRVLFVAGDRAGFAERLARAMVLWQERWPARPRAAGDAAAVHGFRARYEMADGRGAGILAPPDTSWTVVWDEDVSLAVGPPARVVRVAPLADTDEMETLLCAARDQVQGAGVAHLGRREPAWREMLARAGVPFVVGLTRIQDPPAGWRADGRSGLAELLWRGR